MSATLYNSRIGDDDTSWDDDSITVTELFQTYYTYLVYDFIKTTRYYTNKYI